MKSGLALFLELTPEQLDFLSQAESGINADSDYNVGIANFLLQNDLVYRDLPDAFNGGASFIRSSELGKAYLYQVNEQIKKEADAAAAKKADRDRELFWRIMAFVSPFILFVLDHFGDLLSFLQRFFP